MSEIMFISFSTNDGNKTAKDVYDFYRKIGFVVFWSKEEVPPGYKWEDVIEKCLRQCEIFILIATPEALLSPQVAKEVKLAQHLKKFIIPCKHRKIKNWLDLNRLGPNLDRIQGIEFEESDDIKIMLGRRPRDEIAALSQLSSQQFSRKQETRKMASTSKRWLAREIRKRLDDANRIEGMLPLDISSKTLWLLETGSFLRKSFGVDHQYYRVFPKLDFTTPSGLMDELSSHQKFHDAKEELQDILDEIREELDNS